ncbi:MAG: 30S ribosome-binding factor RbfA [Chlorobi bacterium]|nr:MAG: 30S ribosome-binding factor RbfA [Bacteroidota bacterium]KXK34360.1 MAG: ribosome-binding factor A [Chlorobi bacterium OLB6]MBE2265177.1 30S ribosome-binding factor RbfA [Flavobacteriales bacterium]MBL1160182.1 30S ribosome-binding factor RbfA [Chlorobiota bacterium]MBW7853320.1 30S ribosome-binding factor RbfA [Candidatus Kapabacteria bacterium]MCC6332216.1 30S ribosome-binding factor RbfA [Ignavibacteria bacterium]
MSIRTQRVAAEIQKALSGPLQDIAHEIHAGFITVTEIRMSPDLQLARVFLSVYGGTASAGEAVDFIEREEAGRLRHHLARTVRLRYVPQLKFYIDDSLDRAIRIHAILDSVKPKNDDNSEH